MQDPITRVVPFEEYLAVYAADFYEHHNGTLIKMAPVSLRHDQLVYYIRQLLETYLQLRPLGRVVSAPFVMRLGETGREPDLQVILASNSGKLTTTYMDGPADICVEVVSPESTSRDYGEKFAEYERGLVTEYWIIDPLRRECHFYRLRQIDDTARYAQIDPVQDTYLTPVLPQFRFHVPTLWQESLPGPLSVVEAIRTMLNES